MLNIKLFFVVLITFTFYECNNQISQEKVNLDEIPKEIKDVYDSTFVLKKMGKKGFYYVRPDYIENLNNSLNEINKLDDNNLENDSLFVKTKVFNINYKLLLKSIPTTPAEFKIYDSYFSNSTHKEKIKLLERIIFSCACKSDTSFNFKLEFCVLYTNMYSLLYSGIYKDETRIDDGYYFYDINEIICENKDFFCKKVWNNLSLLAQSEVGDLYELYDCRCIKNNINKYNFCN